MKFSRITVLIMVTVILLLKFTGSQLLSVTISLGLGIVIIMGMMLAISLIEILSIMRQDYILKPGISTNKEEV